MDKSSLEQLCRFETDRLLVRCWQAVYTEAANKAFAASVLEILTPKVTKSLPDGWQQVDTIDKAKKWIGNRIEESVFLVAQANSTKKVVGFMFLYPDDASIKPQTLRMGYLISENSWGIGLGSELVGGLVDWCVQNTDFESVSGGVEKENLGSIRVLEKNGFIITESNEHTAFMERHLQR